MDNGKLTKQIFYISTKFEYYKAASENAPKAEYQN